MNIHKTSRLTPKGREVLIGGSIAGSGTKAGLVQSRVGRLNTLALPNAGRTQGTARGTFRDFLTFTAAPMALVSLLNRLQRTAYVIEIPAHDGAREEP